MTQHNSHRVHVNQLWKTDPSHTVRSRIKPHFFLTSGVILYKYCMRIGDFHFIICQFWGNPDFKYIVQCNLFHVFTKISSRHLFPKNNIFSQCRIMKNCFHDIDISDKWFNIQYALWIKSKRKKCTCSSSSSSVLDIVWHLCVMSQRLNYVYIGTTGCSAMFL